MQDINNSSLEIELYPFDNNRFSSLCGKLDENIKRIEKYFRVDIYSKENLLKIKGEQRAVKSVGIILKELYEITENEDINLETLHILLREHDIEKNKEKSDTNTKEIDLKNEHQIQTAQKVIRARGENQSTYLSNIKENDLTFGVGPAGTGKTYLAVASAIEALENDDVRRIILVRPAVEAGERLGFLPGDMSQKVDPYLRPMYDALYDMLGANQVSKLIEQHLIEVAPLAFMRGRTLNDSFIILDEAQNTTKEQIKMFLTRVGFGSTAVINGDVTQIDLPKKTASGLGHVLKVLNGVDGISFTFFGVQDVVRHPLVQKIVSAYESYDKAHSDES